MTLIAKLTDIYPKIQSYVNSGANSSRYAQFNAAIQFRLLIENIRVLPHDLLSSSSGLLERQISTLLVDLSTLSEQSVQNQSALDLLASRIQRVFDALPFHPSFPRVTTISPHFFSRGRMEVAMPPSQEGVGGGMFVLPLKLDCRPIRITLLGHFGPLQEKRSAATLNIANAVFPVQRPFTDHKLEFDVTLPFMRPDDPSEATRFSEQTNVVFYHGQVEFSWFEKKSSLKSTFAVTLGAFPSIAGMIRMEMIVGGMVCGGGGGTLFFGIPGSITSRLKLGEWRCTLDAFDGSHHVVTEPGDHHYLSIKYEGEHKLIYEAVPPKELRDI